LGKVSLVHRNQKVDFVGSRLEPKPNQHIPAVSRPVTLVDPLCYGVSQNPGNDQIGRVVAPILNKQRLRAVTTTLGNLVCLMLPECHFSLFSIT
jgi:hypothetical protein